jgi:hypothetical protein
VPCSGCYIPNPNTSWQWQLSGTVDQSVNASMYDIDLFDNAASVVSSLHAQGRKVTCYLDAGTWENWRPDANQVPASVLGNQVSGWPGERWLDIRQLSILGPIIQNRLDLCKSKGFDSVEFDNVDGYTNNTGFPLSASDQLRYNEFLANAAHVRGLSAALKNDLDQVPELLSSFDWALDEQCFEYSECNALTPFINAGKAVLEVEYNRTPSQFCAQANAMNFNALYKHSNLDAYRVACRLSTEGGRAPGTNCIAPLASRVWARLQGKINHCLPDPAQVGQAHGFVLQQVGRRPLQHEPAGLQHVAAMGDGEGHAGILLDEQHGGAALIDVTNDREDLLHDDRR